MPKIDDKKTDDKTNEVVHEEIELGEDELKQISGAVAKDLKEIIKDSSSEAAKVAAESVLEKYLEKIDTPDTKGKQIKKTQDDDEDDEDDAVKKGLTKGLYSQKMIDESKEMRFFKSCKALVDGDNSELKSYNALTRAEREKAGYANTDSDSDGGALVPDPEFDTTVYEDLPKYGVAFANADVRQTTRNSVRFLSLDSGLEFYETAEAGAKTSGKLAFTKQLTDLIKYAVIVPSTDELTDDAAIDYWALVTKELTRAYAKKADEVVFTHATSGITNTSGVRTVNVSGAGTTLTWDDLLEAEGKTEDDLDTASHKWYLRKETWYSLIATKYDAGGGAGTGDYYFKPIPTQPTTPWGTPVVFTRVLPKAASLAASDDEAFAVYGNLGNYVLYNKKGMALKVLTEATIVDSEESDFNLATQDGTAIRAVIRMLGKLPTGNTTKFVVLGTGDVS